MPRLELQNLLKPTTTPEQEILLTWFYSQFDNKSAVNKSIINVESLYYQGDIAATEFLTYAATKLYICYNLQLGFNTGSANTVPASFVLYNEANVNSLLQLNNAPVWDTTAAALKYNNNNVFNENLYFSRIVVNQFIFIRFNGYRITLQ
jgi:hypothetical protein